MYKFIKTEDEKNNHDVTDVLIQSKHNDVTLDDLCAMFKSFLQACNFAVNFGDEIELVYDEEDEEEESYETVELDLTDEEFNRIAKLAHDEDMTFNAYVNVVLRNQMKNSTSVEEFCAFVKKLEEDGTRVVDEDAVNEFDNFVVKLTEYDDQNKKILIDDINDKFAEASTDQGEPCVENFEPEQIHAEESMKSKLVDTPDSVEREVYESYFGAADSVEKEVSDMVSVPKTKTWENVKRAKDVVDRIKNKEMLKP